MRSLSRREIEKGTKYDLRELNGERCALCSYLRAAMEGANTEDALAPGHQDLLDTLTEEYGIDPQLPASQTAMVQRLRHIGMHLTSDPGFAGKRDEATKAYRSPS